MLQALRGGADKGGGEGGVVSFHHRVAWHAHAVRRSRVGQLAKMGHHIGHREGRVRIQRDGGDLKLLIAKTRRVECLQSTEGGEDGRRVLVTRHSKEGTERQIIDGERKIE